MAINVQTDKSVNLEKSEVEQAIKDYLRANNINLPNNYTVELLTDDWAGDSNSDIVMKISWAV